MTSAPRDSSAILHELVERIAACGGADTYFDATEVSEWPTNLVKALRSASVLMPASPATSVVCPGCEQSCAMPVHVLPGIGAGDGRAFVICDKREDIARVDVPVASLGRMKSSGELLAAAVASLLKMPQARPARIDGHAWNLGSFRGSKHKGSLTLSLDTRPQLVVAGHTVSLVDVLRFAKGGVAIDSSSVRQLVDNPSGNSDAAQETAADRAAAIRVRMNELRAQSVPDFRKQVAKEFGIDPSRVGQLLRKYPEPEAAAVWPLLPRAAKSLSPAKKPKK